jgi:preprotein translocase subunit SecA
VGRAGLSEALAEYFGGDWPIQQWLDEDHDLHEETLRKRIADTLAATTPTRRSWSAPSTMRQIEKAVMLQTLDTQWKDHLAQMDYLRQGIHLRGYAQKNPKQEYKREAFEMFSAMLGSIKQEVVKTLSRMQVQAPEESRRRRRAAGVPVQARGLHRARRDAEPAAGPAGRHGGPMRGATAAGRRRSPPGDHQPFVRGERKVGRNEPCPCGSGKKYKQCHGKVA